MQKTRRQKRKEAADRLDAAKDVWRDPYMVRRYGEEYCEKRYQAAVAEVGRLRTMP